jgi:hypothetical protein
LPFANWFFIQSAAYEKVNVEIFGKKMLHVAFGAVKQA